MTILVWEGFEIFRNKLQHFSAKRFDRSVMKLTNNETNV